MPDNSQQYELLARVDERTRAIRGDIDRLKTDQKDRDDRLYDELQKQKEETEKSIKSVKDDMKSSYVTKEQFGPVQKIVFGVVSIILTAVFGALIALVVLKP